VDHKEISYECVNRIALPQDVIKWECCSEYGVDPSCPIKGREFVNQLMDYHLHKKGSDQWTVVNCLV
jgi:hypothetical protein